MKRREKISNRQKEKHGDKTKDKKGFIAKIMDKLDKKLEDQAKSAGCCDSSNKGKRKSCC